MAVAGAFVDVHSHVVPSFDDGARSVEEGIELCGLAAAAGTGILFATPHVHAHWDSYPWTPRRAGEYQDAFPRVRDGAAELGVDLRRGAELYASEVDAATVERFVLEGTEAVLVELPGFWVELDPHVELELLERACARVEAAGLVPVLAHPERSHAIAEEPGRAEPFVERGALLCLNGPSLWGGHGATAERTAYELLERELVSLVASDGHRAHRPPTLDEAFRVAAGRLGVERATPLFDGSALPWR